MVINFNIKYICRALSKFKGGVSWHILIINYVIILIRDEFVEIDTVQTCPLRLEGQCRRVELYDPWLARRVQR